MQHACESLVKLQLAKQREQREVFLCYRQMWLIVLDVYVVLKQQIC